MGLLVARLAARADVHLVPILDRLLWCTHRVAGVLGGGSMCFFRQMGGAVPCPHLVLTPCGALCHATCVAARPKRKVAADPTPQKLKVRASALCPCIRGVVALHMPMRLQHARDQLTRCRAACSAAAQTRAGVRKHGQPATGGRRYQAASYGAVGRFIEVRANAVHHARCVLGASLAHPHLLVPTQAAEPASR